MLGRSTSVKWLKKYLTSLNKLLIFNIAGPCPETFISTHTQIEPESHTLTLSSSLTQQPHLRQPFCITQAFFCVGFRNQAVLFRSFSFSFCLPHTHVYNISGFSTFKIETFMPFDTPETFDCLFPIELSSRSTFF